MEGEMESGATCTDTALRLTFIAGYTKNVAAYMTCEVSLSMLVGVIFP